MEVSRVGVIVGRGMLGCMSSLQSGIWRVSRSFSTRAAGKLEIVS